MVVCGDLCHFVVVCGRLRWFGVFAMVCGGLSYSHTVGSGVAFEAIKLLG